MTISFAQTTILLANGGETTSFTSLVNRVGDPADTRISANLRGKKKLILDREWAV